MPDREFRHQFTIRGAVVPHPDPIQLSTEEIADAAMIEIAQISASSSPFNLLLDELLEAHSTWFRWITGLGEIRETKTALSGLFGRFVARAYLTRYHGFIYFSPIKNDHQLLSGWPNLQLVRKATGDLPDWVTAANAGASQPAIAEAKGSHDKNAWQPLNKAKEQVKRVDIEANGVSLIIKRYSIATRWSIVGNRSLGEPWLLVDDPKDGDRDPSEEETSSLNRIIALSHYREIISSFDAPESAQQLVEAASQPSFDLLLAPNEYYRVADTDGFDTTAIAAVFTPSGLLPIPKRGSLSRFSSAVSEIFGDRSLLICVDYKTLKKVCLGKSLDMKSRVESQSFWEQRRLLPDNVAVYPFRRIKIYRLPIIGSTT